MKIHCLNCQKAYHPALLPYLRDTFRSETYDFILLQEASDPVMEVVKAATSYRFLNVYDDDLGKQNMLCIAYRADIPLLSHEFHSFGRMRKEPRAGYRNSVFGLLSGVFDFEGVPVSVSSLHLHSDIYSSIRVAELKRMKDILLRHPSGTPVIVAGDCNFGYPWELPQGIRILAPELVCPTRCMGGTLNSRYTEYSKNLPGRVSVILAKVGLGITLAADHFFVDRGLEDSMRMSCRILPDRVSDHSPIELLLSRKS